MMGSEIATAGKALTPVAELLIEAAKWIYKKMTAPQPLRDAENRDERYIDKTRYERLCRLHVKYINSKKIPDEWLLEKDCPTYEASFGEMAKRLEDHVKSLEGSLYPQKLRVLAMVSRIAHLFRILQSKKATLGSHFSEATKEMVYQYAGYRSDGFEAMFFSDLALWLSIELPRDPIHEIQTIEKITNWITYCEEVGETVLIFRCDGNEPNHPQKVLTDVIADLEGLKADMWKAHKASSFNVRIQSVDASILAMTKSVFDLFYLISDGSPEQDIQIRSLLEQHKKSLLSDTEGRDPELQKILSHQMGQWIISTLQKAGIISNSFENLKPIEPEVLAYYLRKDLLNKPREKTGLWAFAQQNAEGKKDQASKERAFYYLDCIAELHRLLLMVYYVRESIVLGSMVSKNLGDAWVYGEDTGKGIVLTLCKVIFDACRKLNEAVSTFWTEFYKEHYKPYALKHHKDNTDHCHRSLAKAKTAIRDIHEYFKTIKTQLNQIRAEIESYERDARDIPDKIHALKQHLSTYVRLTQLPLEENLKRDIDYTDEQTHYPRIFTTKRFIISGDQLVPQALTVIPYEQSTLPYYMRARRILSQGATSHALFVRPRDDRFHSDIQRNIYDNYLQTNEKVANLSFIGQYFSYFYRNGILPDQVEAFIRTYARVQTILEMLYGLSDLPGTPSPVEIVLIDILLNNKIINDFQKYKYYKFYALLPSPPFEITLDGTKILLRLTGEWYDAIKDSLLEAQIKVLITELKSKDSQIDALMAGRIQLLQDLEVERAKIKLSEASIDELQEVLNERSAQTAEKEKQFPDMIEKVGAMEANETAIRGAILAELERKDEDPASDEDLTSRASTSLDSTYHEKPQKYSLSKQAKHLIFGKSRPTPTFDLILITVPSGAINVCP